MRDAELDGRMRAEASKPFDLTRGPVLRAVLFRLAPDRHVLLVTLHHIACDGWSLGVMVREVAALYAGAGDTLGDVLLHYADYVEWQGTGLTDEALASGPDAVTALSTLTASAVTSGPIPSPGMTAREMTFDADSLMFQF